MPTYPHIERYYADKERLIAFGGSDNEQSIRAAFQNCLASYCRAHRKNLELVPELRTPSGVIPDGTVNDEMRLPHGYWEAKDLHDNLDAEIQSKLNRGYPKNNILFENSRAAVLIQHGEVAMQVEMRNPAQLHRLIQVFLNFVTREVEEFHRGWQQFKEDLPIILKTLQEAIQEAAKRGDYQAAASSFLELCHRTIGPEVTEEQVQDMLIQHLLTKDIFLRVFSEDQFHRENNIARQLDALAQTFFTGSLRRQTMDELLPYYGAITGAAANIGDYREKQRFLKAIYEDFYQIYDSKAADRMGVVYTPNEVVDFIIHGTDHLLQQHFGRTLADDNVQILDPATGTGTFVTSLIDYLPPERLEYKYTNEIHANELAILPYYMANLNIEYTYKERTGKYLEFPNLCFVDTLDNMDWQDVGASGRAVQRQGTLALGGLSEENWLRIQSQNEKPISVIIGNPPYNANQQNENDNNKNREYAEIDKRIKDTYVAASTAQKTKQYDMYKRFLRWASDRMTDNGIIGFVSNNAFLDSRQDDGFRKELAQEFNELWVIDLKGNARTSGERRQREKGNIFQNKIRVGVAIYFLVRRQGVEGFHVFYNAVDDYLTSAGKIEYIKGKPITAFAFREITPDADANWLNHSTSNFQSLLSLANKETKFTKFVSQERAVFKRYSMGVVTNRDDWTYDFDAKRLSTKVRAIIRAYEDSRTEHGGKEFDATALGTHIKWTRDLKRQLLLNKRNSFQREKIRQTFFRPFVSKALYFDRSLNEMQYQLPEIFPKGSIGENKAICFCVNGRFFYALATDRVVDLHFTGDTQCLSLYRYTSKGRRISNITKWGLRQINDHYREAWGDYSTEAYPNGIGPEDVFAYTYAVLHDPVYRHDYEVDLKQEFPRLPLYKDFNAWARMGKELLDLHIGFESADPFPLERIDTAKEVKRTILRADKVGGRIVLDDITTLTGVPEDAWRYRLGNRSALEWVLDQYKEKTPKDPTIREKFNTYRFADYKEQVIDLLRRVCTVSVRTMEIVDSMAYWDGNDLVVWGDREQDDLAVLALEDWARRPEDPEWEAAWSET